MERLDMLSLFLFVVFILVYTAKLILLRMRNGIHANVLGRSGKTREITRAERTVRGTTFVWGIMWFVAAVIPAVHPIIANLSDQLPISLKAIGIIVSFVGVLIFSVSIVTMRTSWRVGIDKETKTALVTNGIYSISRNPAFVGFDLMFIGVAITYLGVISIIVAVLNMCAIHLLILQEEKHLEQVFPGTYITYQKNVGRYVTLRRTN